MSPASGSRTLARGVWGVVPTPFEGPDARVDETGLVRLAEHYERVGAAGLTVLGVFGEAARLSMEERRRVLEVVAGATSLPLVAGVTARATAPAVEEACALVAAARGRAAAVMVQVHTADPECLRDHLAHVAAAAGVPVVVQDYPVVSGVSIPAQVLAAALADASWVAAVKAESPPTAVAVAALATALPGVPVFGGLGGVGLLDELAAGAAGAMTGFSFPEGLCACVRAFDAGGSERARDALLEYLPLMNFEQQPGIALGIRKEAFRRRGLIDAATVRPPGPAMPDALSAQLDRHLAAAVAAADPVTGATATSRATGEPGGAAEQGSAR